MTSSGSVTDRKKLACAMPTYTCGQNPCVSNYDTLLRIKRACIDRAYILDTITVAVGGSGYSVGDYIQLDGGTPVGQPILLQVESIDEDGGITGISQINSPPYINPPPSPTASAKVTGGGIGATFTTTFISKPTMCVICAS